jgi:Fur family peroxide stress response transcriptional regulator
MSTVDEFMQTLRRRGLNVTYQRILIYKHLATTKTHPTAEDIYIEVKSEYPSISIATVYKTLETLAQHNLINKVNAHHDQARFDGVTEPHHHMICVECKKIVDVYNDRLGDLPLPKDRNFKVLGYRIQFEGICKGCESNPSLNQPSQEPEKPLTFCGRERD